jgi:hypothetical protein
MSFVVSRVHRRMVRYGPYSGCNCFRFAERNSRSIVLERLNLLVYRVQKLNLADHTMTFGYAGCDPHDSAIVYRTVSAVRTGPHNNSLQLPM